MRFRRLELIRYGGYADRVFDFGEHGDESQPDLHLIVGPNEAGKSTTLQAIGDLLFGIQPQTDQNWRYDYSQLRLRALIEHSGGLLDLTRRKGNKDTLLQPDGSPFPNDPLGPLLGGVDRAAFERMFGLDHAKLRAGGESILSGRDDAARITLEAGTGVSHIGRELAGLSDAAAALFKPGGQNPMVNRLMRERAEALAEVRQCTITDAEWTQARQRRASAEDRRRELIDEAEALDREHARLDRIGRARVPLARLEQLRREREDLGQVPDLPLDATERLTAARAERTSSAEMQSQICADLTRVDTDLAAVAVPGPVLVHRAEVEALEERRPVIVKAAADLERRRAELERIDARIAAARTQARIDPDATLPTAGWRRRVTSHLEALRDAKAGEQTAAKERARLLRDREKASQELSGIQHQADPTALQTALAGISLDGEERKSELEDEAARKTARAAERLSDLMPWRGSAALLASLDLPTEAEASQIRRAVDLAQAEAETARKDVAAAETNAIRAQAKLDGLAAGGALPTPEVVAEARALRDELVGDVHRRLTSDRQADDVAVARALADAVQRADLIADRRDAEAKRVAEHVLTLLTLEEARGVRAAAETRKAAHRAERLRLEDEWNARLASAGFERPLLPADWAGWLTRRAAALDAERERETAALAVENHGRRLAVARAAVAQALREAGGGELRIDDPDLLDVARAHAVALADATAHRRHLAEHVASIDEALVVLAENEQALAVTRQELDAERARLAREVGMPDGADGAMMIDALEALNLVADEVGARDGIARQIEGIEHDRLVFERDLDELLSSLGLHRNGQPVDQVRQLGAELAEATRNDDARRRLASERERLAGELERIERRLNHAQSTIDSLVETAGVGSEGELDRVLADAARLVVLRDAEDQALAELAGTDNGAGLEGLAAEIAALPHEEEVAARLRIEERRRELASEREEVGRALNAAEDEATRAAENSAAADAQQRVAETTATLAQSAEEHVATASAAALLRWVIDRHRATNQAPLIARADALFAQVTAGAFTGLTVGYGDDDRPSILARRADGTEVGVDALSEGTRDQLYLTLRLGSIGTRASVETLPIICDDLLITADDRRAAALLSVLSAAAAKTQVIVFSHHEHLIEVASRSLGAQRFKLHRINPTAMAA